MVIGTYETHTQGIKPKRNCNILTVLGCGWSLPADIANHGIKGDVMSVTDVVKDYPGKIHHAVSMHTRTNYGELMESFKEVRKARKLNTDFQIHSENWCVASCVDFQWTLLPGPADSGHLAALIGVAMGYERVRLLGVPLNGPHYYDLFQTHRDWDEVKIARWESTKNFLANVKSASGLTKKILGGLDDEAI